MERVELTRRAFLKRTAIAFVGLTILPVTSSCVYDEYHVDPVKNLKPGEMGIT